jgi:hypothetical protein
MRAILVLLVLLSAGMAQKLEWDCTAKQETLCLRPFGVLRGAWVPGLTAVQFSAGVSLGATYMLDNLKLQAQPALVIDSTGLQVDLIQAFVELSAGEARLGLGKKAVYSGPWDDALLDRWGKWGLWVLYAGLEAADLELAYMAHGSGGGQGFVGIRLGAWQLGTFIEAIRTKDPIPESRVIWSPRLGFSGSPVQVYWQLDRGVWTEARFVVPLSRNKKDDLAIESLFWWNPNWGVFSDDSVDPADRWALWIQEPSKLYASLGLSWQDEIKLGLDLSRAPVEQVRVYLEWRF